MRNLTFLLFILALGACQSAPKAVRSPAQLPLSNQVLTKIEFSSCAHQKMPQPIWKVMQALSPDLYVGMGDNVYASSPSDRPFSEAYRLQAEIPEFAEFRKNIPIIAIWDDHDFGVDDGGKDNPDKLEAKKEFLKFFPEDANLIPPEQEGLYHSIKFGPDGKRVQIILLDLRTYRDSLEVTETPKYPPGKYIPTTDKKKTILGEDQWKWFETQLTEPADLRIIISSHQFITEENGFEKWSNFPSEKQRFISLLEKYKIQNSIIMSGDRHFAEITSIPLNGTTLFDITASAISRVSKGFDKENKFRIAGPIQDNNFSFMQIDWENRIAHNTIIDVKGVNRTTIDFKF